MTSSKTGEIHSCKVLCFLSGTLRTGLPAQAQGGGGPPEPLAPLKRGLGKRCSIFQGREPACSSLRVAPCYVLRGKLSPKKSDAKHTDLSPCNHVSQQNMEILRGQNKAPVIKRKTGTLKEVCSQPPFKCHLYGGICNGEAGGSGISGLRG